MRCINVPFTHLLIIEQKAVLLVAWLHGAQVTHESEVKTRNSSRVSATERSQVIAFNPAHRHIGHCVNILIQRRTGGRRRRRRSGAWPYVCLKTLTRTASITLR